MSEPATIIDCLLLLKSAYPRQELTDQTIDVYEAALQDIDPGLLRAAVLHHVSTNKWFPTVAELRNAAANLVSRASGQLLPGEAWEQVVRKFRQGYSHSRVPEFDELTAKALGAIGGWHYLCYSDNIPADRARFIQAYEQYAKRAAEDAVMLPAVSDYVGQLADGSMTVAGRIGKLAARLTVNNGG